MKSVYDALDPIVNGSLTEKEKGTKYELACVWYLKNDPYWSGRFSRVGTLEESLSWQDCPIHDSQDTGIDLVAQTEVGGYWCAIQCKCYDSKKDLPKGVCDSFFARTAYDKGVDERIVMTSAAGPGKHLTDMLDKSGAMLIDTQKMASSNLDWTPFVEGAPAGERVTHDLRPHQLRAVESIVAAFADHDRCKAVMACGTGKTLMSLRLAEGHVGRGTVLFCAPSISLVGQSMREWMAQARVPMTPLVVCSDSKASRLEDSMPDSLACFEYPATTNAETLAASFAACRAANPDGIVAVFSTYQSIDVIHRAQGLGVPEFDLVVCDEAHRTTGAALPGVPAEVASAFMKVHYDENVRARKRLYMTATPRIYGETAKRKGAEEDYTIASMDDETIYGPTAYQIKFGEAVERKLLTDYKVVVLTVQEDALADRLPSLESDQGVNARTLEPSDIGKIIGCWKGLVDHGEGVPVDATGLGDMLVVDEVDRIRAGAAPLHRAVGFCSTIEASKTICEAFAQIVESYAVNLHEELPLRCDLRHVDGNMPADARARNITWLGEDVEDDECRILTNARCLAEGIDVPNLDAVIFFNAKNSTVDVVQAVGRVMRRAQGKRYGYIILPIFVPAGMTPEEALDDSKVFANVWSILQALRSHDERIEAKVNALALQQEAERNGFGGSSDHKGWDAGLETAKEAEQRKAAEIAQGVQLRLSLFPVERWERAVKTQLVKKCGTRIYWDEWAEDVAKIAQRHIERIGALVRGDEVVAGHFAVFLKSLRDSLNPGISEDDAVEMIAQHIITVPVFDALFGDFEFAKSNPVSVAIDGFLTTLSEHRIEEASDVEVLEDVYASVRRRAAAVRSDAARQQLIRDLYERFFKVAFSDVSDKMGVVYTPTEIIDYILRETDRALCREFGVRLADEGVHVLDPFAGTGSFMAHLIESDLIPDDKLEHKYRHELHSNEILLLAYYIMTVNIEYAYHQRMVDAGVDVGYVPFDGAVLTDTFQMTEEGDTLDAEVFSANSERVRRQNELSIRVIVGNPPYSVGQSSTNDNNQNEKYPLLDDHIAKTYVAKTDATNKNSLYDSYFRAFRWASDRLGDKGVVCFVSNGGWIDGSSSNGFRRSLTEEFNSVYVFNLKGNQNTSDWRREGGKVFDSGAKIGVAITMLVKNPASSERGVIHYNDIGDFLSREDKLRRIRDAAASGDIEWKIIEPDKHGDWLNQRDDSFYEFAPIVLGSGAKLSDGIFTLSGPGTQTNRDVWITSFGAARARANAEVMISNYNDELSRLSSRPDPDIARFASDDPRCIKWTSSLTSLFNKRKRLERTDICLRTVLYRPFCKYNMAYTRGLIHRPGITAKAMPINVSEAKNLVIVVNHGRDASAIITNCIPDVQLQFNSQCFPLYWYEQQKQPGGLFVDEPTDRCSRHDAITDTALTIFREVYPCVFGFGVNRRSIEQARADGLSPKAANSDERFEVAKVDIFYYVYGILHSEEYRARFAANLKKELPRIPLAEDFRAFSEAGRRLADLHLNYEAVGRWGSIVEDGDSVNPGRTEKMTFGKCKKDEEHPDGKDMTVLHVAQNLTLRNIPLEAYDYVVNGRSAIGWLMDRYQVRTDKASGIVNDPNDYSDDPRYIVDLVESVVTVSIETMNVVRSLPPLHERPQPADWPMEWKVG